MGIISGGKSEGVRKRFEGLGVPYLFGSGHKMEAFRDFCKKANISPDQVAYMGDDLSDIPMNEVGLSCAPNDACSDVIDVAMFISEVNGDKVGKRFDRTNDEITRYLVQRRDPQVVNLL